MAARIGPRSPHTRVGGTKRVAAGATYFTQAHCKTAHRTIFNIVIAAAEAGAPGAFTIFIRLAAIRTDGETYCAQPEQGNFVHVILRMLAIESFGSCKERPRREKMVTDSRRGLDFVLLDLGAGQSYGTKLR
jgi:hypothetical protein